MGLHMTEQLTLLSHRVSVTQVQYPQRWNPFSLPSFISLIILRWALLELGHCRA